MDYGPARLLCDSPVKNTEWFPSSFSRRSSRPSDRFCLLRLLYQQADSLPLCHLGSHHTHPILAKWPRKGLNRMGKNLSRSAPEWHLIDGKRLKDRVSCWKLPTSQVFMIREGLIFRIVIFRIFRTVTGVLIIFILQPYQR